MLRVRCSIVLVLFALHWTCSTAVGINGDMDGFIFYLVSWRRWVRGVSIRWPGFPLTLFLGRISDAREVIWRKKPRRVFVRGSRSRWSKNVVVA